MKRLSSLLLFLSISFSSFPQLDVYNSGLTGEQMVEALSGVGFTFTNIDVTGCPLVAQMAQFNGYQSDIEIDSGLIMTTGDAFIAEGLSDGQYFYHIDYEFKGWFHVLRWISLNSKVVYY